ncbi:MAG: hypothetical protein CVV41_21200 [Candidatus Riflebacteria bacterium HGW-Riflebacteria-1]|jgi:hypothetical protein|nr:MAG: hypothetical protein CVV41_21200 [Candidatus Riflebacteria bacterium HGW-Riflebacteria-1]
MQETKHKFYELADALLHEAGLLANRPTWIKLRQLVHDAPPDFLQSDCKSDTYAILLAVLKTPDRSAERVTLLGSVIESVISKVPDESLIQLLKLLASDDLSQSLLPCMYRPDFRGSTAVYLAARTSLHLTPEAFQYFLGARLWQQADLINLSFLVRPGDAQKVCALLKEAAASEQSVITKDAFTEFCQILASQEAHRSLTPDGETQSSATVATTAGITAEQPEHTEPAQASEPVRSADQAEAAMPAEAKQANDKPAETSRKPAPRYQPDRRKSAAVAARPEKSFLPPSLVNLVESNRTAFLILFVMTTLALIATGISSWMISDTAPAVYARVAPDRAPKYWTDSATREQITQKYLAADKDYRMGELYLTRDRYSEALILFEDALSTRPDHLPALYRVGYCRFNIKDYPGARTSLEKALKIDSAYRHANLLLAKIAAAQKNNQLAEHHFKRELELDKDPAIAIEYANFLHGSGKENEAKAIISEYQALYPDRIFVLSKTATDAENKEQRQ